jgi:hypothetical protein
LTLFFQALQQAVAHEGELERKDRVFLDKQDDGNDNSLDKSLAFDFFLVVVFAYAVVLTILLDFSVHFLNQKQINECYKDDLPLLVEST